MASTLSSGAGTPPVPLTDEQIQSFLANGYLNLQLSLPSAVNEEIYWGTDHVFRSFQKDFNPHNNIMPMVPGLWQVHDDPVLRGAAQSLLGDDYLVHPHRHCHTNFPKRGAATPAMLQGFHKDGHAMRPRPRHREPRWLIMFYYPQDTPGHRGPTAVMPGSHLLPFLLGDQERGDDIVPLTMASDGLLAPAGYHQRRVEMLTAPAGTATLCHFDIGHGASVNGSAVPRYAHKFVLMRTRHPDAAGDGSSVVDDPVIRHLWRWLGHETPHAPCEFDDWQRGLAAEVARERVDAIYRSGEVTDAGVVDVLLEDVAAHFHRFEEDPVLRVADAVNGLALLDDKQPILDLMAADTPAAVGNGCFAAGQAGLASAVETLARHVAHDHPGVRRQAMTALGLIGSEHAEVAPAIIDCLASVVRDNESWDERLFAVQGLIRLGPDDQTVDVLAPAAHDRDAYVSAFAIEQLCRIDSDKARRAVLEPLRRQRWWTDNRYVQMNRQ